MAFHFPLMPRMFLAIRQADRRPITDIFRHTPDLPSRCQWCLFLRNHDARAERAYVRHRGQSALAAALAGRSTKGRPTITV